MSSTSLGAGGHHGGDGNVTAHEATHGNHGHEAGPNTVFGFWLYLMTDCILFATIFAGFAVARKQFAGGPTGHDIIELPTVIAETTALLFSSVTYGFAMLAAHRQKLNQVVGWLVVTFILGASFITMEIHEFAGLIARHDGPDRSAYLSAFFTLVGTHGLHVTMGLIWMATLIFQMLVLKKGLTPTYMNRLTCLSLFWHFLDIVWLFVFTIVYLMSVV